MLTFCSSDIAALALMDVPTYLSLYFKLEDEQCALQEHYFAFRGNPEICIPDGMHHCVKVNNEWCFYVSKKQEPRSCSQRSLDKLQNNLLIILIQGILILAWCKPEVVIKELFKART